MSEIVYILNWNSGWKKARFYGGNCRRDFFYAIITHGQKNLFRFVQTNANYYHHQIFSCEILSLAAMDAEAKTSFFVVFRIQKSRLKSQSHIYRRLLNGHLYKKRDGMDLIYS
ncbi:CLUMA_CG002717, isoform A [Clunio marinus]|uniref:CLUMA_CG002717, isoform A n=1 Tax=Clunio marinus TaxID=568069 RepID=A0A1J1HN02_9DIPT|nr:CLUMA_CG002717, isoform A [Clunio marinus]